MKLSHIAKNYLKENSQLIDQILDKINKKGQRNLSSDERDFLSQYNSGRVNDELENWLLSNKESTFNSEGKKLLYDEFEEDEDIFYNEEKLKRVLSKHLGKKPFTNNADWGGGFSWNVKSNNNFIGVFYYLGDDELVVLNRESDEDGYEDEVLENITNTKELYRSLVKYKK